MENTNNQSLNQSEVESVDLTPENIQTVDMIETPAPVSVEVEAVQSPADESPASEDEKDRKPGVEDILRAVITDDRVGHFIVDVLSGRNVIESISERFNISAMGQAVVDGLVSEAEERGYLRGRNEQIETKMSEPGMWQSPAGETPRQEAGGRSRNPFLRRVRRSVWD